MKYIYGICTVVGTLVAVGSAGLSGCGPVDIKDALLFIIGGLIATFVGSAGLIRLEGE